MVTADGERLLDVPLDDHPAVRRFSLLFFIREDCVRCVTGFLFTVVVSRVWTGEYFLI